MKPKSITKSRYYTADVTDQEAVISKYEIYVDEYSGRRLYRLPVIYRYPTLPPYYNVSLKNAILLSENQTATMIVAQITSPRQFLPGEVLNFDPEIFAHDLVKAKEASVTVFKKNLIYVELINTTNNRITINHGTLVGTVSKCNTPQRKPLAVPSLIKSNYKFKYVCKNRAKFNPAQAEMLLAEMSYDENIVDKIKIDNTYDRHPEKSIVNKIKIYRPYNVKTAGGNRKGAKERKRIKKQQAKKEDNKSIEDHPGKHFKGPIPVCDLPVLEWYPKDKLIPPRDLPERLCSRIRMLD